MTGIRRVLWGLGVPARFFLLGALRLYRSTLSGLLGDRCRFYPSCSHYAEDAIGARGALAGIAFTAWRVFRCNPFGCGGIDHAPGPVTRPAHVMGLVSAVDDDIPILRGRRV